MLLLMSTLVEKSVPDAIVVVVLELVLVPVVVTVFDDDWVPVLVLDAPVSLSVEAEDEVTEVDVLLGVLLCIVDKFSFALVDAAVDVDVAIELVELVVLALVISVPRQFTYEG